jgi:hypothetical protein
LTESTATLLPVAQFPFVIGDELLGIDGNRVQDVITSLRKYSIAQTSAARIESRPHKSRAAANKSFHTLLTSEIQRRW